MTQKYALACARTRPTDTVFAQKVFFEIYKQHQGEYMGSIITGIMEATLRQLDAARERLGLHVQGVLVGDRETMGLMEVCDDIFWVRDWRRHGDERVAASESFSPVHSKSLTALYFPNALSPRAARHRPS